MKRIYLKMLWRAVQLRSGLLVAVLISDSVLAAPAEQGRQVGEPVWITVQRDEEIPVKFWEGGGKRGKRGEGLGSDRRTELVQRVMSGTLMCAARFFP